jgi:hypothetical protein
MGQDPRVYMGPPQSPTFFNDTVVAGTQVDKLLNWRVWSHELQMGWGIFS